MTAPITLAAPPPPWRVDGDGAVRVGGTRVTLHTVIGAFKDGCTPEQIVFKYPTLHLADVYAVIAYYFWHRDEIDAFLAEEDRLADELRREIETAFPMKGVRERLLARQAEKSLA